MLDLEGSLFDVRIVHRREHDDLRFWIHLLNLTTRLQSVDVGASLMSTTITSGWSRCAASSTALPSATVPSTSQSSANIWQTDFALQGGPDCDRDRKWSHDVRRRLRDAGIRVVLIPERAPNANAYAERFVRSIKEECLDSLIPIGERHFRQVITEFIEHYHRERNHQGLDNRLIAGTPMTDRTGRVRCRRRLGGLLNFYERAA